MNKNMLKTYGFLTALTLFIIVFFSLIFGHVGAHLGVLIAVITLIIALCYSDKAMLNLYRAKEATDAKYAHLQAILKALSTKIQIPTPTLYTIDTKAANVFGIGKTRQKGGVVVTEGLLSLLSEEEQTAVLAYTIGQICERQTFLNTVVSTIAGFFAGLANLHVDQVIFDEKEPEKIDYNPRIMEIVAPIAAFIVKMMIKPSMILAADANAIQYGANARALINALEKLTADKDKTVFRIANARPATAHLFIVNPLKDSTLLRRFDIHPSLETRISALDKKRE